MRIKGENCIDCMGHGSCSGNSRPTWLLTRVSAPGYIRKDVSSNTPASYIRGLVSVPTSITAPMTRASHEAI